MKLRARIAIAAVLVSALSLSIASPAAAASYPSWDDVQNAKNNEAAKQAEIDNINRLIDQLATAAETARAAAATAAEEYSVALGVALEAEEKSASLATELETAKATAEASSKQAGSLFAKLGRMNTADVTASIFVDAENADSALYKLGALSKLTSQQSELFAAAERDANLVSSLSAQADVAAQVLEQARADAEAKLQAAQEASAAADAALAEQQANEQRLVEQLAFLKDTTAEVEAQYAEGERIRKEEEAKKAAEAAKRAAEAAANGGGYYPPSTGNGTYWQPSTAGWYRPLPGPITSLYGKRPQLCTPGGCSTPGWHSGLDFGGACGSQIKAIQAGTVVYAQYGYNNGHGNRVMIDHGGVTSTYGHIQPGGILVGAGQQVAAGQVVGLVGRTGVATGCHLDLKINDGAADPLPFLRSVGVAV